MPLCEQCGMPCTEPEEIVEHEGFTFCGELCLDDWNYRENWDEEE